MDINSGKRKVLARTNRDFNSGFTVGKYNFSEEAFDFATGILNYARAGETVFLDEAGPLELKGKGYAGCIKKLLKMELSEFYVVVRKSCLRKFKNKFLSGFKKDLRIIKILRIR